MAEVQRWVWAALLLMSSWVRVSVTLMGHDNAWGFERDAQFGAIEPYCSQHHIPIFFSVAFPSVKQRPFFGAGIVGMSRES